MEPQKHSSWYGLLLPGICGLASAALYFASVSSQLKPVEFVQIQEVVRQGHAIPQRALRRIAVSGDTKQLSEGALLWSQHGLAVAAVAARDLRPGQLLLADDLDVQEERASLLSGETMQRIAVEGGNLPIPDDVRVGTEFRVLVRIPRTTTAGSGRESEERYLGPYRVLKFVRNEDDAELTAIEIATREPQGRPDPDLSKLVDALGGRNGATVISLSRHQRDQQQGPQS